LKQCTAFPWDRRAIAESGASHRRCVESEKADEVAAELAIDRVQQIVDVSRELRDMRLVYEIQVTASHGNDIDTALAYGAPSVSDISPITKIRGAHKHNSPREGFGLMGIVRAHTMFEGFGHSSFDVGFWSRNEKSMLNAGGNIRVGIVKFQARDDPQVPCHFT
jgi:hypothetical protein